MEQQRPRLLSRGVVAYQHKRSRRRRRSRGDFFFSNKAARRREEKEGETTNEEEDIAPSVCTVCVCVWKHAVAILIRSWGFSAEKLGVDVETSATGPLPPPSG